jgi:hypothetical protein
MLIFGLTNEAMKRAEFFYHIPRARPQSKTRRREPRERERVERVAASEEIARNTAEVERLLEPWLAASHEITAAFRKLDHTFEAGQIGSFIANAASEVEVTAAVTLRELQSLATLVATGDAPIPPDRVEIEPEPEPEPEVLTHVFSMSALEWHDASGVLHRAPKWTDVELSAAQAERALRHKKATRMDDPRRTSRQRWFCPRPGLVLQLQSRACARLERRNPTGRGHHRQQ